MARTIEWKTKYSIVVSLSQRLFDSSVDKWNRLRTEFASWCQYYHNINAMDDPPPNHVINNDIALDNWLRNKRERARQEKIKQKHQAGEREFNTRNREVFYNS